MNICNSINNTATNGGSQSEGNTQLPWSQTPAPESSDVRPQLNIRTQPLVSVVSMGDEDLPVAIHYENLSAAVREVDSSASASSGVKVRVVVNGRHARIELS